MDKKDIEHLESLLLIDFNKHIKNRMQGYCKKCYRIALSNNLNPEFIFEMKMKYFNKFQNEIFK